MSLKLVPKPQGFDLRDRRSEKTNDASKWLPEDVLFSAQQEWDKKPPVKAAVVAWFYRNDEGELCMTFRLYNESDNDGIALATKTLKGITQS